MKRSSLVLVVVLAPLALGSAPRLARAQASAGLPGTYTLVTINGHALPYAPVDPDRPANAPPAPTVVGGTFVVGPDSTFRMSMTYRVPSGDTGRVVQGEFHGTYARQGADWNFTWTGAGQTPVTLRGDTLTLNNVGMLFAYVRQPQR
jgi:hypothetical protein